MPYGQTALENVHEKRQHKNSQIWNLYFNNVEVNVLLVSSVNPCDSVI